MHVRTSLSSLAGGVAVVGGSGAGLAAAWLAGAVESDAPLALLLPPPLHRISASSDPESA